MKIRNLIRSVLTEEVKAKPVVKKGEKVKVYNYYNQKWQMVTAATNSEYNDDFEDYEFLDTKGACITWESDSWVIDPSYQT